MNKLGLAIILSILINSTISSQTIDCNDLLEYIEENGHNKATIPNYILSSSWLNKVTAYSFKYKIYVVADIKENEYSFKTSAYIFCGIPNTNWQNFQFGGYGDPISYGERFHKYIIDYKCNCN